MIHRHTLTLPEIDYFRVSRDRQKILEGEYYKALGHAKEADIAIAALNASRDQQISIIAKNAKLPAGKFSFSEDGSELLIDTPDQTPTPKAPKPPGI